MRVQVINLGVDPLKLSNDVRVELRAPQWDERQRWLTRYTPLIIVELEDAPTILRRLTEESLPRLTLARGEACQASFELKDVLRHVTGKQKVRVWAKVLGRISEAVSLEVDFGNAPRSKRALRSEDSTGPFRLTWGTRLHRFARQNRLGIVTLCAVAGCLLPVFLGLGWRRRRARRSA